MYYPIIERGIKIGDAQVSRTGLYYGINCRLKNSMDRLCRINVCCGDRIVNLGTCVPINGVLGINTSIPVKLVGDGELMFSLAGEKYNMIPILDDEPLICLSEYRKMRYISINGQAGITFIGQIVNL